MGCVQVREMLESCGGEKEKEVERLLRVHTHKKGLGGLCEEKCEIQIGGYTF